MLSPVKEPGSPTIFNKFKKSKEERLATVLGMNKSLRVTVLKNYQTSTAENRLSASLESRMQELSEKHSSQKKYKLSKVNRFIMPKAAVELDKWKRRKR